ncbi:hypothetical protein [Sphingomonas hengshuiensis]|uniref:hypothetical protein n=1 Tax=Sphingomonas hengshuiensis TaxID=1609977 RepID=UPI0012B84BED|nr:hypothetical protein [Sphingomonas hengshuiensis]
MTKAIDNMEDSIAPTSAATPVAPQEAVSIRSRLRSNNFDELRLIFASMVMPTVNRERRRRMCKDPAC